MPGRARTLVRSAVGAYRRRSDLRWRRVPSFDVLPARGTPSVYYVTPYAAGPHGGIRVAFRHVDLLNRMGINAAVLYPKGRARPTWFENVTPMVTAESIGFHADDILVVPEVYGPTIPTIRDDIRVLIFNQGAYITYNQIDPATTAPGAPYAALSRLEGIMTVSEDSAELLALAHPETRIDIARPVVDAQIFHRDDRERTNTIAYVPTRRAEELNQVLHILRARGVSWELKALRGLTEEGVGEALRSASIFLSLSDRDGFGLPPAEAMACGTYVVGYRGGGGREFFDPDFSRPVDSTFELITSLDAAMSAPPEQLRAAGRRASEAILGRYTEAGLRSDLDAVFSRLI